MFHSYKNTYPDQKITLDIFSKNGPQTGGPSGLHAHEAEQNCSYFPHLVWEIYINI